MSIFQMPSVAVIGAGPAGLVTARKLLQSGEFHVTVYERGSHVGGLWSEEGLIYPEMRTNLSNFTVSFSDLSWESVPLQGGRAAPMYPKARQVREYLEAYHRRFIPPDLIQFNTTVERVETVQEETPKRWKVWTKNKQNSSINGAEGSTNGLSNSTDNAGAQESTTEKIFDYLVVAPGFFARPQEPNVALATNTSDHKPTCILHSSQYSDLSQIFAHGRSFGEKRPKVLVVGGSHSGSEVASLIALQSCNSKYAPKIEETAAGQIVDFDIIHITSHEMFAIPAFVRNRDSKSCAFQPMDFLLYNRSNRPSEPPPSFTYALVNPEKIRAGRDMIRGILDGDSTGKKADQTNDDSPPYAVVSETYNQFVVSGQIEPLIGTLKRLEEGTSSDLMRATVTSNDTKVTILDDVAGVIYATGFDSIDQFSLLPAEVKAGLDFDDSCSRVPLVLNEGYLSQNASVPRLAVVGFPGSYWGILEMQARAAVSAWTQTSRRIPPASNDAEESDSIKLGNYIRQLREAIHSGPKTAVSQNPFGDYVGLMEQASRELDLERVDLTYEATAGPTCPARYIDKSSDRVEAEKTLAKLQETQQKSLQSGRFVARAVFQGLLGTWAAQSNVGNQISFHPRFPTDLDFDFEYLCVETRDQDESRTIYRYQGYTDQITMWSVSSLDSLTSGQMLSSMNFISCDGTEEKDVVVADCLDGGIGEGHNQSWRFVFNGATMVQFTAELRQGKSEFERVILKK